MNLLTELTKLVETGHAVNIFRCKPDADHSHVACQCGVTWTQPDHDDLDDFAVLYTLHTLGETW